VRSSQQPFGRFGMPFGLKALRLIAIAEFRKARSEATR
jgi:hypothetical protein